MLQHFSDVWYLINWKMKVTSKEFKAEDPKKFNVSSVFKHFANLCSGCVTKNQVRARMKTICAPSIIWQGDRIKCMKSVNTLACKLCMQERIEITKRFKQNRTTMINDKADLFSSCTCKGHFHTFMTRGKKDTEDELCFEKSPTISQLEKEMSQLFLPDTVTKPPIYLPAEERVLSKKYHERHIFRENKPPLIDTNVPGLPFREPREKPGVMNYDIYKTYRDRNKISS